MPFTTKQVNAYAEQHSECTVKFYGYFNGFFGRCLREKGRTEQDPGPCKKLAEDGFQKCMWEPPKR